MQPASGRHLRHHVRHRLLVDLQAGDVLIPRAVVREDPAAGMGRPGTCNDASAARSRASRARTTGARTTGARGSTFWARRALVIAASAEGREQRANGDHAYSHTP